MSDNQFFKSTVLYKEYMILDMIEKNSNITQREISKSIGIAVSMTNDYIHDFETKGLIKRKRHSKKNVEYFITKKGSERRKVLNISYLSNSLKIYKSAKENISIFINQINNKGFKKILLYGAGEVSEILLQSILTDKDIPIKIVGVIDDDYKKQGQELLGTSIMALDSIVNIKHDGILIASYTNKNQIMNNLLNQKYDPNRILNFFQL
jgi:DNA-binding MarR family transcriptional regulator